MLVILSGIVIEVKLSQYENARSPILVTLSGITISPSHVKPSIRMPFITTMGFSVLLPSNQGVVSNAPEPILVTLSGIVIEVKLSQYENA